VQNNFNSVARLKNRLMPKDICKGDALVLLPFVEAIFELKFKEEPLYNKLRFNLARILLEKEIRPSDQFEWTRFES
jgi:hypothetical protein